MRLLFFVDKTGDLFDGAINAMFRGFGGYDLYPSIIEKACILCFNIISFHCFSNANKRTGIHIRHRQNRSY